MALPNYYLLWGLSISIIVIGHFIDQSDSKDKRQISVNGNGKHEKPIRLPVDGCPYSFDFKGTNYNYRKPEICQSLLPLPPKTNSNWSTVCNVASPFGVIMTPPQDSDGSYYNVGILKAEKQGIISGVIRVQRLKPNGKIGPNLPAGHLEAYGSPGIELASYCCANSKFKSLLVFKTPTYKFSRRIVPKTLGKQVLFSIRWYPMNFGEGRIIFTGNIFSNITNYWKLNSTEFQIPLIA